MMIFPIYGSTRSLVLRGFLIPVRHSHYKSLSLEGATYSETIKKSKFMCVAKSCFSPIEASKFLDKIKDDKANHHCWAFKIGDLEKCDDDGEPQVRNNENISSHSNLKVHGLGKRGISHTFSNQEPKFTKCNSCC